MTFLRHSLQQVTDYPTKRCNLHLNEDTLNDFSDKSRNVWIELAIWMNSQEFLLGLCNKFQDEIIQRMKQEKDGQDSNNLNIYSEIFMAIDQTKYKIGPHTDLASKLVTLLLYFAEDDSRKHLGTSMYIPKQRELYILNSPHLGREYFDLVQTLEYKPNSAFMFVVSGKSFHGVEPINEIEPRRQLIQYQIMHR